MIISVMDCDLYINFYMKFYMEHLHWRFIGVCNVLCTVMSTDVCDVCNYTFGFLILEEGFVLPFYNIIH